MKSFLDMLPGNGWKTYAVGIAAILYGVGGMIVHYLKPDSSFSLEPQPAMEAIAFGLACLGIGHKIDKATEPRTA